MISFFIKYRNPILITTVIIFLASIGVIGAGVVADQYNASTVLAKVGDAKIKYKTFANAYDMVRQKYIDEGKEISEEEDKQIKQEIVQDLIMLEALNQSAKDLDIGVSKAEVAYSIKSDPAFAPNGEFNKNAYIYVVRNQFHVNPAEFEETIAKRLASGRLRRVLVASSMPTSFEKNILMQGASSLKDEEKRALESYLLELKVRSFTAAFSDALNATHKSTINIQF